MNKKILIVGASGLLGSNILKSFDTKVFDITLLLRKELKINKDIKQIVTEFSEIDSISNEYRFDEVYIAIGKRLSIMELAYLPKKSRKSFEKVDHDFIKNIALFGRKHGATSIGLISAVGAKSGSLNSYLDVKGKTEDQIISMGYEKVVIARPGHLLGERLNEPINYAVIVFELVTNILGYFLIGPLKKYKNISASDVAFSLISKMSDQSKGIIFLEYDDLTRS